MCELKIIQTQFEFDTLITCKTIPGSDMIIADFSNTIFKCPINANNLKFGLVSFDSCIFEYNVTFENTEFCKSTSFIKTVFSKTISFQNCLFKEKVRFFEAEFYGIANFNNTKFADLADFWNATFHSITIFYKTDFLGTTVFSATKFEENILFTYSLINKVIIFRATIFQKGIDLSLAIIGGEVSIFDISLNDFKDIPEIENAFEYEKNVREDGLITRKNKRETFRIIKNQLIKQNNNIDFLKFYSLEVKSYGKQLSYEILKKNKWRSSFQNAFILLFNWISNKHGRSWLRGITFTLITGLLFFYLSILQTENYNFGFTKFNNIDFTEIVKYFFTFMLPTHNSDFMQKENPTTFFYIWDFIGRICISYGIYQTIQAFRKFKNK